MSAPRRVVFDTSTLVGAALRVGSLPHRALTHTLSEAEVYASAATLAELDEVLMRRKFDRFALRDVRRDFIATMRRLISLVDVSEAEESNVHPTCRDPKDNKFLALIKVCGAEALIASDADLLVLHPWNGVPVLTPSAYVALVSA